MPSYTVNHIPLCINCSKAFISLLEEIWTLLLFHSLILDSLLIQQLLCICLQNLGDAFMLLVVIKMSFYLLPLLTSCTKLIPTSSEKQWFYGSFWVKQTTIYLLWFLFYLSVLGLYLWHPSSRSGHRRRREGNSSSNQTGYTTATDDSMLWFSSPSRFQRNMAPFSPSTWGFRRWWCRLATRQ